MALKNSRSERAKRFLIPTSVFGWMDGWVNELKDRYMWLNNKMDGLVNIMFVCTDPQARISCLHEI